MSRRMPSKWVILEYWVDNMPDDLNDGQLLGDQCWACGDFISRLERAHIKPLCEGGTNLPDNLHLLCTHCHQVSELLSGDAYWAWYEDMLINHFDFGMKRHQSKLKAYIKEGVIKCSIPHLRRVARSK